MKTTVKKVLVAVFLVTVSTTFMVSGMSMHHQRANSLNYFEHPALKQLATYFRMQE